MDGRSRGELKGPGLVVSAIPQYRGYIFCTVGIFVVKYVSTEGTLGDEITFEVLSVHQY